VAEIVWRARARRHLTSIAEYLRDRNPHAAADYLSGLREACLVLEDFPEKGRRYNHRYRAIVFRNHLVFYQFDSTRERVVISAVFDGRRDVDALLRYLSDDES
jgi:plasmid stabilization system protein ParE